jgi:hypothetical protein
MANNPQLTNASASAAADAAVDRIDGGAGAGLLRIYDGTQPATADTAITTQVLLAELTFNDPAFGNASNGTATANAITADASANATGTASWARWVDSTGATVLDCTVGTSGADINLNTTAIVTGAQVTITSLTYTQSKT